MLIAVDVDGCIDAAPRQFQSVLSALKAAGHTVVVVTGTENLSVTQEELEAKADYLTSLGCGACWDVLVVTTEPHDERKAQWLAENHADILVDNNKSNAKAATKAGVPLVLVPWASRED